MLSNKFWGVQSRAGNAEVLVSALGSIISISSIAYISFLFTGYHGSLAILPSMGAATVLLFAMPHATLSQPWALFAGNILSAVIGVCCAQGIDNLFLASGMAVGLAVLLMHLCRCIHPPGGATALAAVIGGDALRELSFWYVITPTLINCLIIFLVALVFNYIFPWRRYPLSLMHYERVQNSGSTLQVKHIHQAIESLETPLDVSDELVSQIVYKANQLLQSENLANLDLQLGAFYTNGMPGLSWSVRQVVDEVPHEDPCKYIVVYRTVDGDNKYRAGSCSLQEFAEWAKEKMQPASLAKRDTGSN